MPVVLSYPGVYVEEIPSGQFTITGVATSITAFVGRALCGPTDQPVTLFNFGDYERMFGGLAHDFPLSYAVQDFFMNGGGQAVIARLFEPLISEADWTASASAALTAIQKALTPLPSQGTFDADALIAIGTTAAAALPQSEQGPAAALMQMLEAKTANVTTAADFATAVAALTAPPHLGSSATIDLSTNGGGDLAAPVVAIANAVLAAAFDTTGNKIGSASVTDLYSAAALAASDFQSGPQKKLAQAALQSIKAASSAQDAVQASLTPAGSAPVAGSDAPPGPADLIPLMTAIQKAVVALYTTAKLAVPATPALSGAGTPSDAEAGSTPSTVSTAATPNPAIADMAASIATNVGTAGGADAVTKAANAASTAAGATVLSVINAAVQTAKTAAFFVLPEQYLSLVAANAGSWGNNLTAKIDFDNITPQSARMFANFGLAQSDLFNLTVFYTAPDGTTDIERFTNLTVKTNGNKPLANRADQVLASQSQYVRVVSPMPAARPPISSGSGSGGDDGQNLSPLTYVGDQNKKTGIYMLNKIDLFNLLCIPPDVRIPDTETDTDPSVYQEAMAYCVDRRAMLIVDPPAAWSDSYKSGELDNIKPEDLQLYGPQTRNAAVYFPRVIKEDLLMDGQLDIFPACGAIAGVIAATDVQRGVWKAPAGQNAGLTNISTLAHSLTDDEQGELNPLGINCLRNLPLLGPVVWGARTLRGADQLSDDFKYLSVRRLALFLEESLYRGTRWAVFEPNDEALWSSLRLSINAFMGDLARQGAFYGFKIKCDKDTNSQTDIDKGIVTVLVQYAPVKPAEFVVLQFQQQAGLSPS